MPVDFYSTTAQKIESLSRERTVFFFPVGPLEDHGPHLPLGLDLIEAQRLCEVAALKLEQEMKGWTAVILPAAPLGVDSNTTHLALTVRPYVLRDWLVDSVRSLKRLGFRHFACFSGHLGPKQLTAIEEAGKIIARGNFFGLRGKAGFVSLSSALISPKDVRESPFWPDTTEHGGETDTSLAIFANPELVEAMARSLPLLERDSSFWGRAVKRATGKTRGYWGEPQKASAEKGKALIESKVQKIFPRLEARLTGIFAPSAFRSWYSVIPTNRSFFKSWMLALAIFLVLAVWASINISSF